MINRFDDGMKPFGGGAGHPYTSTPTTESGTETVDVWDCVPECPVRMLDAQSGVSTTKRNEKPSDCSGNTWGGTIQIRRGARGHTDTGGASRFFFCAKASKAERGEGNKHPTVKPLKLMSYLVRLVTPPGGLVLDPFLGSGTTAISCVRQGFRCIGIDNDAESIQTAVRRLDEWRRKATVP